MSLEHLDYRSAEIRRRLDALPTTVAPGDHPTLPSLDDLRHVFARLEAVGEYTVDLSRQNQRLANELDAVTTERDTLRAAIRIVEQAAR